MLTIGALSITMEEFSRAQRRIAREQHGRAFTVTRGVAGSAA
jgi:hypothetical protein